MAARRGLLAAAVCLLVAATAGTAFAEGNGTFGSVPEMSPGVIGSALTVLAGGALLVRDRLRGR
jgi:hypothetical protein